jgi:hypothetical protein
MTYLPRLELTADPNKNNDYIIYHHSYKKTINPKTVTKRMSSTKRMASTQRKGKQRIGRQRKTRKGIFNIF